MTKSKSACEPCGPRRKVAIFGAGVSGLSAAHELAERGFEVDVYEMDIGIGGMARTQYALAPHEDCAAGCAPGCCCEPPCGAQGPMQATDLPALHPHSVLAFSADGQRLAGGSVGVSLWRTDTGLRAETLGHRDEITALSMSTDKSRIITGNQNGFVEVWATDTRLRTHCIDLSDEGSILAVDVRDTNGPLELEAVTASTTRTYESLHTVHLVDQDVPAPLDATGVWHGDGGELVAAFGFDGGRFVVLAEGCEGPTRRSYVAEGLSAIKRLTFSTCGCLVLLLDADNRLLVGRIDGDDFEALGPVVVPEKQVETFSLSGCGCFALIVVRDDNAVSIQWRRPDALGEVIQERLHIGLPVDPEEAASDDDPPPLFEQDDLPTERFAISRDGERLLVGLKGRLMLWSLTTGSVIWHELLQPPLRPVADDLRQDGQGHGVRVDPRFVALSGDDRVALVAWRAFMEGKRRWFIDVWDLPGQRRRPLLSNALTKEINEWFGDEEFIHASIAQRCGRRSVLISTGSSLDKIQAFALDDHWAGDVTMTARAALAVSTHPCAQATRAIVLGVDPSALSKTHLVLTGLVSGQIALRGATIGLASPSPVTALAAFGVSTSFYVVATGHEDGTRTLGTLKLSNSTGDVYKRIYVGQVHQGALTALEIKPDSIKPDILRVLSGGRDRLVHLWTVRATTSGTITHLTYVRTLHGSEGPITAIAIRPLDPALDPAASLAPSPPAFGDQAAVASRDPLSRNNAVALWDLKDAQELVRYEPHPWRSLPGEHGFRFFPAFYRHVFDTMERTRIRNEPRFRVADNLVPTTNQGIALEDGLLPHEFSRKKQASTEAILRTVHRSLSGLGYTMGDTLRFQIKVMKFLTSSDARRKTYQEMSWWDFIEGSRFSPGTQRALNVVPRVLVAMDAKRGDALTQGIVMIQLMMDQGSEGKNTDRVLKGPSSEMWFNNWQDHLEDLGVRFHFNHAVEQVWLTPDKDKVACVAVRRLDHEHADCHKPALLKFVKADFYIMALPMRAAQDILRETVHAVQGFKARGDVKRLLNYNVANSEAWMSGLQFYFDDDFSIVRDGHIYYPDSAWGLSSVAQAQFWDRDLRQTYGIAGIISVVIGDWDTPAPQNPSRPPDQWWQWSQVPGLNARQCTPEQIARETWRQINAAANGLDLVRRREVRGRTELPEPLYYHLDDKLVFSAAGVENLSKYLIAPVGEWEKRPGKFTDQSGYTLQLGNLTFAGNFMKTHTRITTMESANESGRHAANAVLSAPEACYHGERAAIFPIERWEPADADPLKELDDLLFKMGKPHMLDIIDAMAQVDRWCAKDPEQTLSDFVLKNNLPPELADILRACAPSMDAFYRDATQNPDPKAIDNNNDRDYVSHLYKLYTTWSPME